MMTRWATAPQSQERLVLCAQRLEDALPRGHTVRLPDEILGRLDWSGREPAYNQRLGQPAIRSTCRSRTWRPTATVDLDSGLIVGADVLAVINEDTQLVPACEEAQRVRASAIPAIAE